MEVNEKKTFILVRLFQGYVRSVDITSGKESLDLLSYTNVQGLNFTPFFFHILEGL